jgi:integrase
MHRSNCTDGKRILNDEEIHTLWPACGEAGAFGALVKVLLLTAQRRDKVAIMRRGDLNDGISTIPAEAREKSNAGSPRLPQTVLDIIEAQPRTLNCL